MIRTNIFTDTSAHKISLKRGHYAVLEYFKDISVTPEQARMAYYTSKMNLHKRQLIVRLKDDSGVIVQAKAMQLMLGDIQASTNIQGIPDLVKSAISAKVTKETVVKPLYYGDGLLVLEPTYKYILLENLADWNGSLVVDDGMFLACDEKVGMRVAGRNTISSIAFGKEGLWNTEFYGDGLVALESPVPEDELILVDMENDIIRIDGNMAIAWSNTLEFTVEKITSTLVGSWMTGEKLVNVYKGTGRLLVAPVIRDLVKDLAENKKNGKKEEKK